MSSNIQVKRICELCGEEFIARTTVTRFCGEKCAKKAYKARKRVERVEKSNLETFSVKTLPLTELNAKEYLTVREVAMLLNSSIRTAYRLIDKGQIKAVNLGIRKTLIKRSDIDKLFE